MPTQPQTTWYQSTVVQSTQFAYREPCRISLPVAANQYIPEYGLLAVITAASANCTQTLTNTATGGTFTIQFGTYNIQITSALNAISLTAAQLQTALTGLANIGVGGCTVAGTPFSSGAGSLVVTFTGALANQPQPLFVINNGSATGGTIGAAMTTAGVANGSLVNYNGTFVAGPTAAPALSAGGSDGTFDVGDQTVSYTYVTAGGESLPGAEAGITLAATNHIAIATINTIPTGVLSLNFYVNAQLAVNKTVSSSSVAGFNILAPAAAASPTPPTTSTATLYGDGSQNAIGISWYSMTTTPSGVVIYSGPGASSALSNDYGSPGYTGNCAISGVFLATNVNSASALDARAIAALTGGRGLLAGSLSSLTGAQLMIVGP